MNIVNKFADFNWDLYHMTVEKLSQLFGQSYHVFLLLLVQTQLKLWQNLKTKSYIYYKSQL